MLKNFDVPAPKDVIICYNIDVSSKRGRTWLRRRLRNLKCMPRMSTLVNKTQLNTNANDENFAGEAIAA